MHHARTSVGVALHIVAHAVFGADDQSAVGNPGIDNLEVPALDPFTTLDPNFIVALAPENGAPDDDTSNIFALNDVAPMEVNMGSVGTLGFPNSDMSRVTEGLTTISETAQRISANEKTAI